ncbi:MAG: hypothetical protein KF799_10145 [Bdellovibrionales bacterium]|nr:hypothetical protein [Bdellovibrionales bacterium]
MKSWVTIALVLGLCVGCRPSDQNIKSVRDRVMAGEFVQFSRNGQGICGGDFGWDDMRLTDEVELMRVVAKKQGSYIAPGFSACYRVGDTVTLELNSKRGVARGQVRIDAVGLVLLDKLYGRNAQKMSGRFFQSSDNLDRYKAGLTNRMYPEMEGVVTVVNFTYIRGSAPDEATLKAKEEELSETSAYKETSKEGDSLGKCNNWTDFDIHPDVLEKIKSGELRSWYRLGTQNCLQQGVEAGLRLNRDLKSPIVAKVKVTKIKSFRVKFMEPSFFELNGFKYETLKSMILKENEVKKNEFMTVTDFEYIGEVTP